MAEQAGTAQAAQEKVQDAAGQAQEKVHEAAGKAEGMVREQIDSRTTEFGGRASSTSSDLRSVGQKLRDEGQQAPADLADRAADQVERVGWYLRDADADTLLGDIEDFGRRQPVAVLAGGVVLGIVAARFLKASSERRFESNSISSANGGSAQRIPASSGAASQRPTTPVPPVPTTQRPPVASPPVADPSYS